MTSHLPLVRIRTNHGYEFENSQLLKFCELMRIKHEFFAPITPRQNGVVETKKNRVLVEMARVMLNSKNFAKHFLVYISNREFLRYGAKQTPYVLWKDDDGLLSSILEGESPGLDLVVDLSTFSKLVDQSTLDNSVSVDLSTCHNQPQNLSHLSLLKTLYRSKIGSLLYLTAGRPDISYNVGVLC
ncbi:hypothetical protein L3X38_025004 [Prunus dulcis]|uniref:Integrase catalytic domain-containing protein n=1 Tax=Prunus dulcis TaxID=3755 RepID=A0AAD4W1P4_PRUDU|nr:hypothetical protein L3X38_025004 [Prunus dulcis]